LGALAQPIKNKKNKEENKKISHQEKQIDLSGNCAEKRNMLHMNKAP